MIELRKGLTITLGGKDYFIVDQLNLNGIDYFYIIQEEIAEDMEIAFIYKEEDGTFSSVDDDKTYSEIIFMEANRAMPKAAPKKTTAVAAAN